MDCVGVYEKYHVRRTDGQSRKGKKHDRCIYFVLDLDHDPFAVPALAAYAEACRKEHPALAKDLRDFVRFKRQKWRKTQMFPTAFYPQWMVRLKH